MTSRDAQTPVSIPEPELSLPARARRASRTPTSALWRAREYVRPYYGQLAFMLAAALLSSGTEIVIPLLTKAAIDGPIAGAARTATAAAHGRSALVWIGAGALALGITQVVLNAIRRWVQASAVTGMERAMRDDLYAHLQRLEPGFHDAWQSGQLLSRATTDLSAIRRFAGFGTIFVVTSSVSFAVIIALLVRLNPFLGLLTMLFFIPVTLLCLRFERRYRVLSRRVQDQQGDLATNVEEAAAGIRALKALGRRDVAGSSHRERAEAVYRTQVDKARLRGAFWASLDLLPNVAIALILLLGTLAVSHGALSTGGLVAFIALMLQLVWPVEAMGYLLALGQEAATAAQRVYEILDTTPAITSPVAVAGARPGSIPADSSVSLPAAVSGAVHHHDGSQRSLAGRPGTAGLVTVPRPRPDDRDTIGQHGTRQHGTRQHGIGRLVLDHVGYRYPGSDREVLSDVCLALQPGETVALVGATGSGKTTLLSLIARLADATSGTILLDGVNIADLPLPALRTAVAYAFEDPTLFSASVRENVTLGAPGAPESATRAALAAAQAEFVADLPWGLDTRIGEQGMTLSGGQRQRIALARAISASPSLLLLDDPLSALDVHTEAKVTRALGRILATSTALVVAHRPSTVALADRVIVLDQGQITAEGTHHNLLAASAHYRHLMASDADMGARR